MASTDCATIVKRGYLHDKKGSLLDRKRWYVLRQDLAQGCCLLEWYKDEKSASRREPPKSFINVHDVVEVRRVPEKKQTFEILCPGFGHKLTANSEVETEEWMDTLKRLILYRRDDWRSQSLKMDSSSPLNITPSHSFSLPHHMHSSPPQSLSIPLRSASSSSLPRDAPLSHSPMKGLHHSLPTPPESNASPPIPSFTPASMQRQQSSEFAPPLPSPPSTSSDSSSMCSGSNASFDAQSVFDPEAETRTRFRVQVKESEGHNISGPVDLVVNEEAVSISLHSVSTGQQLLTWPIGSLRRYGVSNVCFTVVTGRYCSTGEGRFQFYSQHSRLIHSKVHAMAVHKASTNKRGSEQSGSTEPPPTTSTTCPIPSKFSSQAATRPQTHEQVQLQRTSQGSNLSPPHHTHTEYPLPPPTSHSEYDKLNHSGNSATVLYSRLSHGTATFPLPTAPISSLTSASPSATGPLVTQPQMIPQVQVYPCAHCAPRQVPFGMATAATLQSMNMTGQVMYLSSSPCQHHLHHPLPPQSPHQHTFTPSHITPSHLQPHTMSHGANHTVVTSYSPVQQPLLTTKSRSFSNQSNYADFPGYHGERGQAKSRRARSITSPTLL